MNRPGPIQAKLKQSIKAGVRLRTGVGSGAVWKEFHDRQLYAFEVLVAGEISTRIAPADGLEPVERAQIKNRETAFG